MPNQIIDNAGQVTDQTNAQDPGANPDTGKTSWLHDEKIPKEFRDEHAKLIKENTAKGKTLRQLQDEADKRTKAEQEAADKAAIERGDFTKIAEENKLLRAKEQKRNEALTARITGKIEKIPETSRDKIKSMIDKIPDLDDRETFIDDYLSQVASVQVPSTPNPKPAGTVSAVSKLDQEIKDEKDPQKRAQLAFQRATLAGRRIPTGD